MTSSTLDEQRIGDEVKARLIDYWWDVDANDAREALDFYTAQCLYVMCGHRMEGPPAVADYYAFRTSRGARLVRHVLTNLRARILAPDRAWVQGVLTVYADDGEPVLSSAPPILIADNEATFVRSTDGAWRMCEHHIKALFQGGTPVLIPPSA